MLSDGSNTVGHPEMRLELSPWLIRLYDVPDCHGPGRQPLPLGHVLGALHL